MKVLSIPSWFTLDPQQPGGIVFKEQAAALRAYGIDISLLHLDYSWRHWAKKHAKSWTEKGVPIKAVKTRSWPKTPYFFHPIVSQYAHALKTYFTEFGVPNLIHAHSFLAAAYLAKIKTQYRLPIILTEHSSTLLKDDIPQRHKFLLQKAYHTASHIIAVSEGLKANIQKIAPVAVERIPNLIDAQFFSPLNDHTLKSNKVQIISIGDPVHTKGLDILIKSLGIVKKKLGAVFNLQLGDKIPDMNTL